MRKQKYPILENVCIEDFAAEGKSLAKVNGAVVFVPFSAPGDLVDIQVTKKRKQYMEGRIVKVHEYSPRRVKPFCEHFGYCGGCKWQHVSYEDQLAYKQQTVVDHLTRIGHLEIPEVTPILPSKNTRFYRNKLEYTFCDRRWFTPEEMQSEEAQSGDTRALGFHIPGMFDKVLDIRYCHFQADPSNAIRLALKKTAVEHDLSFYNPRSHEGFLRNVMIRNTSTGHWMVVVVFAYRDDKNIEIVMQDLQTQFPEITSLLYVVNEKFNDTIFDQDIHIFKGNDFIIEEIPTLKTGGRTLQFKIGPKSFFQTNTQQAFELYRAAAECVDFTGNETVYDLYTGTGSIAQCLSLYVKKVVGIEYVPEAIEDAKENAAFNKIENTEFFAGDMVNVLNDAFVSKHGKPDIIVTDPPRAGMHADVVAQILKIGAPKIIYISCNSATQARDLELMKDAYEIKKVQPVDMFPHTHHVENIVYLEKR